MKKYSFKAKGYDEDSKWEFELRNGIFKNLEYHPEKVAYTIEHNYEPDWKITTNKRDILIEAKGRFRDASEPQKYMWIRKVLKPNEELVFLFQKPHAPIYFKAKRKDGTKMTHAEWAEKNKFRYFDEKSIQEIL